MILYLLFGIVYFVMTLLTLKKLEKAMPGTTSYNYRYGMAFNSIQKLVF